MNNFLMMLTLIVIIPFIGMMFAISSKENSNQGHPTRQPTLVNKPGSSTKSCNWLFIAALKYELK